MKKATTKDKSAKMVKAKCKSVRKASGSHTKMDRSSPKKAGVGSGQSLAHMLR
jgi:hypothetical protein